MKKVVIYKWNKMNEIKVTKVNDAEEYARIMDVIYKNDGKGFTLIGELNLEDNLSKIHVTSIFNKMLKMCYPKCPVVIECDTNLVTSNESFKASIKLRDNDFVESSIINLHNEFYRMMEMFFEDCGFKIHGYNNIRNIFWFNFKTD